MPKPNNEKIVFGELITDHRAGPMLPDLSAEHGPKDGKISLPADLLDAVVADGEVKIENPMNCLTDQPACFSSHMGVYLIEPTLGSRIANQILSGGISEAGIKAQEGNSDGSGEVLVRNGVAIIGITGVLQKGRSKFGGTSTVDVRRQLATAVRSDEVDSIFLKVFSPGGSVDGIQSLGDSIAAAAAVKPVHAHVDDMGASAALWALSQANTVSINRTGDIGSIGAVIVVADFSKKAEREGVKVHVVRSAPMKAIGQTGEKITPAFLKEFQEHVDAKTAHFIQAVADGRGMKLGDVMRLATGKMFPAKVALKNGLVDFIMSDTEAFDKLASGEIGKKKNGISLDKHDDDDDTQEIPDIGDEDPDEETDTLKGANMDPKQIKAFLQSDTDGQAIAAELVKEGIAAAVESGEVCTKASVERQITAALAGAEEKNAASAALNEQARTIAEASDGVITIEKATEELSAVSGDVRSERFLRMKAEAETLSVKNAKAPLDETQAKSNEEKFEKRWAAGELCDKKEINDPVAKAESKEIYLKQLNK